MGHHWKIEAATGPTSIGVCLKCGEQREFSNSAPASGFGDASHGLDRQTLSAKNAYLKKHFGDVGRAKAGTGMDGYNLR